MNARSDQPRKVILAEFNEITWRLIDPFCREGALPSFSEYVREGARGAPGGGRGPAESGPRSGWTSLYTGRPQEEHNVRFLEQPPETVRGPRLWEVAADAGKSLGLFGSIMSWPPRHDVPGFWIPGTFSPDSETHPESLRPIQDLNLTYTRAHSPTAGRVKRGPLSRVGELMKHCLRATTLAKVAAGLYRDEAQPGPVVGESQPPAAD